MPAVIYCNYIFRNVVIGWPGSVHDTRVFSNSAIFTKGRDNCLFLDDLNREICGVEMPPVIIADSAYPLLSWVLKGYTLGTRQQEVNVFLTIVLVVHE
jgi:hypothetical protein